MKRNLFCHALPVIALCLVASSAIAADCEPINVRIGPSEFLGPCSYNGMSFDSCIDAPIRGTLNGMWHYFAPADRFLVAEPDPPFSWAVVGWALGVLTTNRGEVWLQDNWLFNLEVMPPDEGFRAASMFNITGGSGHYDGAYGWIGAIYADLSDWRGWMRGEICTP